MSNQENVFPIKTYLTTRQVYSASEVHNCKKIDWRSCGSRCRLKLVHFAWTMGAIIGRPTIREMSLRLTQSAQNKSLIIIRGQPGSMIRAYKQQQRKTDDNTWISRQEDASRSKIRPIIVEEGVAAFLKWAKNLVCGLLFLCGLWIEHPSNNFFGATNARMPWTCFWQTLKIWALLKWVY